MTFRALPETFGPHRLWVRSFSYGWKIGRPGGQVLPGTFKTEALARAAAQKRFPEAEITR